MPYNGVGTYTALMVEHESSTMFNGLRRFGIESRDNITVSWKICLSNLDMPNYFLQNWYCVSWH